MPLTTAREIWSPSSVRQRERQRGVAQRVFSIHNPPPLSLLASHAGCLFGMNDLETKVALIPEIAVSKKCQL